MMEPGMSHQSVAGPSQPARRKRTHKQRFSRSRTGCLTCRTRRIRCDETHPVCERCTEIETTCTWPPTVQVGAGSSGRPSRQSSQSRQVSPIQPPTTTAPTPNGAGNPAPPVHTSPYPGNGQNGLNGGSMIQSRPAVDNTSNTMNWGLNSLAGMPSFDSLVNSDTPWDIDLGSILPNHNSSFNITNAGDPQQVGGLYAYTLPTSYATPAQNNTIPRFDALPTYSLPGSTNTDLALYNNANYSTSHLSPMALPLTDLAARGTNNPIHNFHNQFNNPMPTFNMPLPLFIPSTIPEPIEQVFPSADSKRVFQHVRSSTSTIVVALGLSGDSSQNGKNPFMAMALRTILMNPTSHAQTAFRHALLSLGATHVCHQYAKSSPEQCQAMRVRTIKSKRKALAFLSIDAPTSMGNGHMAAQTDLVLATCLTLCLRNNLSGDTAWQPTLDLALRHIARRGGAAALLAETDQGCDRRFLIEQIAVADLFSTWTTGEEPLLLGQSAAWWREAGPHWSETHWEAYERYLGISREMTEYIAKYRIICARKLQLEVDGWPAGAMATTLSESISESAESLLDTLKAWEKAPRCNYPRLKRVQDGDSAYRHMIEISLLTGIQAIDIADSRVQTPVRAVLELCSQMSQEPVNLLWPLLTAGACCTTVESRQWVRQLFDVFRQGHCRDLEIAESLLLEQWTRADCKAGFTPWAKLMKDMGQQVCLI